MTSPLRSLFCGRGPRKLLLPAILTVFAATAASARRDTPAAAFPVDLIRQQISFLASDALAGRGTGQAGNEKSAQFLAGEFRKCGLKPVGTDLQHDTKAILDGSGYYQPFLVSLGLVPGKASSLQVSFGGETKQYTGSADFLTPSFSGAGKAAGTLIFAGYGIRAEQLKHDDYAGLNVRGKVVLVLPGSPKEDPDRRLAPYGEIRRKGFAARFAEAAALLYVVPDEDWKQAAPGLAGTFGGGIPILGVRRSVAEAWLKSAGKEPGTLRNEAAAGRFVSCSLPEVAVSLFADMQKVEKDTANVVGLLEGSDPELRQEIVVIGAHMDHLGMGGFGSLAHVNEPKIHPGADDNASGTAGVLALARAFSGSSAERTGDSPAARPSRPKRSLLFVCFSGEERGLLGSGHYVSHPILPLEKTVAMLNMDMIGRLRDSNLTVLGSGTSPVWNTLLAEANQTAGLTLTRDEREFAASDHYAFYRKNIPVLFFFTGMHPDYHTPRDTADKINYEGIARLLPMAEHCVRRVADEPMRPAFNPIALPRRGRPGAGQSAAPGK